jgi:hypothetical protein
VNFASAAQLAGAGAAAIVAPENAPTASATTRIECLFMWISPGAQFG